MLLPVPFHPARGVFRPSQRLESLVKELREQASGLSIEKPLISPAIGKLSEDDPNEEISHSENSPNEPKRIASKKTSKTRSNKTKKARRTKAR